MKMTGLLTLGVTLTLIAVGDVCRGANQISGAEDGSQVVLQSRRSPLLP